MGALMLLLVGTPSKCKKLKDANLHVDDVHLAPRAGMQRVNCDMLLRTSASPSPDMPPKESRWWIWLSLHRALPIGQ